MEPRMILEWLGIQLFQFSFAGLLGVAVVAAGEIEGVANKYGAVGVVAVIGVLLGKYFAFRPKTIEAQAAARKSDIQTLQDSHAEVVKQITESNKTYVDNLKEVHKLHIDTLITNIQDVTKAASLYRARADRNEAMLTHSRTTKHTILQELSRQALQIQTLEGMLAEKGIPFEHFGVIDMRSVFKEEDDANKALSNEAVATSQNAANKAVDGRMTSTTIING